MKENEENDKKDELEIDNKVEKRNDTDHLLNSQAMEEGNMEENEENKRKNEVENNSNNMEIVPDPDNYLNSQDINASEQNIMKGDSIGDTLYSAKWIINILISLSNVYENGWDESIESDLCTLWDMTADKDIVKFLLENDFFNIARFTLETSKEPRQTEIIVGIIGNMCCEEETLRTLVASDELISLILALVSSDDKETVIQVLRIIHTAMWDIQKNPQSLWLSKMKECEVLGISIPFILSSSTSDELLTPAIDLVYLISEIQLPDNEKFLEDLFNIDELISNLCEAMIELIDQTDNTHSTTQLKNIENWLNIIFNMIKNDLLKFTDDENDENFGKINNVLLKILQPYSMMCNLVPPEENCLLCIQRSIKLTFSFQKNEMVPIITLIQTILRIIFNLKEVLTTSNEFKDCEDIQQLYDYASSYWIETLGMASEEQILQILKACDEGTINVIIELTESHSKAKKNCTDKLLKVQSKIFSTE